MMTRRGLIRAAGLAPLGQTGHGKGARQVQQVTWDVVPCPRCGLDVCFLPSQRRNRCAWCGKAVRHRVAK